MRAFFLLLGFSQCARADLECIGRYLMDPDKCRLAEVNRVFDVNLDICFSDNNYASDSDALREFPPLSTPSVILGWVIIFLLKRNRLTSLLRSSSSFSLFLPPKRPNTATDVPQKNEVTGQREYIFFGILYIYLHVQLTWLIMLDCLRSLKQAPRPRVLQ